MLHTLNRYPELDVLVLHGPLVYLMGQYAGHVPFTDEDVDLFLRNYGLEQRLKEQFHAEARRIYPQMTEQWRAPSWVGRLAVNSIAIRSKQSPPRAITQRGPMRSVRRPL